MTRIPYLVDLINFLKNDSNIISAGLDKTILVYSEWTIQKLSKNWDYGIILQPLDSPVTTETTRRSNCKGQVDSNLLVGVQVRNSRSTQQHFEIDDTTTDWTLAGAYPDAAAFEEIVRQSILDFNAAMIAAGKKYNPLTLIELQEPEELNGFLMLKQLYKTSFVF